MSTASLPHQFVKAQPDRGVWRVELDSPTNRNALSRSLVEQLFHALRVGRDRDDIHVMELTGRGPAFCSGADLSEVGSEDQASSREGPGMGDVLGELLGFPVPTVCRINGPVRAGGIGLLAACDIAFAPTSVTFAFPETQLGLAPAIVAVPTLRTMSHRGAYRYLLTGETFTAREAVAIGLLTEAFDDEHYEASVTAVIDRLRHADIRALAETKRAMSLVAEYPDPMSRLAQMRSISERLFASEEARKRIASVMSK